MERHREVSIPCRAGPDVVKQGGQGVQKRDPLPLISDARERAMKSKQLVVDAIIPVFNGQRVVGDAIESALNQSVPPRTIMVVDDGSTDSTSDYLEQYRSRIRVLRHRENLGLPAARNTGIRNSDADLLAFLDADDVWSVEKLEKQLETFGMDDQIGLCYTSVIECDMRRTMIARTRHFKERRGEYVFPELYLAGFPIPPSCVMVRREVFETCGMFNEEMLKAQDFECWLRIAMRYRISCIAEPLCQRRINPHSITSMAGTAKDIHYATRAFELCASAAERWGIGLPLPVDDRKILFLKRRCYEAIRANEVDAADEYRRAWEQLQRVSRGDRFALSLARAGAATRRRVMRMLRIADRRMV